MENHVLCVGESWKTKQTISWIGCSSTSVVLSVPAAAASDRDKYCLESAVENHHELYGGEAWVTMQTQQYI